ncbi:UNVERIFIED_CONTAM: Elongation factor 1-gamma 2 [Sesamum radiatum]|uniref:Elongation factor 1-gamma 2 n=1 Tax=Sesamum radiatum TaxID=300843 RepID=A0AAW2QDL3_SESRA
MGGSAVDDDWEFPSPSSEVRTIVLVGRTGNGKSATGNSILRRRAFKSMSSSAGVTSTCELQRTILEEGQILNVIDTPGLFDFSAEPEFIGKEIVKCINMAKDGIHAVLVVLSVRSRFSREEEAAVQSLHKFFGSKISDYMIVVFTGGDDLEENDETLDDYLGRDCPEPLKETLKMCGNRYVLFNNKTKEDAKKSEQLKQLLSLVNSVVDKNGGKPYTDELFVELKKGANKLRDQTAEVNSLEGYSKQEICELKEQFHKSYEEQLKRITEMVESKLKETTHRLEMQLAEEQTARLKAEAMAQAAQMKSNDEIRSSGLKTEKTHLEKPWLWLLPYFSSIQVLHASSTNKNAFKALIAAEYSGVKVELTKDFEMGVSNKTPEFLKMNPIGKVPVLETPEGPIFESNAIARYVARLTPDNPLYGSSLIDYGHIEQWMDFSATEIDINIARWLYPRLGYGLYLPPAEEAGIAGLKRALEALNTHLASNTYLVGHGVTLADIVMTCNLSIGFKAIMTKSLTSQFPHVERYFWTMVNQPNFKKILGDIKQAESIPPVASKKPAQVKEPAKPKPKEEPKKEVKKEEVKPKEVAEEEEAPKPKAKNPLDLLPPSKMILDEWKRLYSNTKTNFREVAIKGFWDMYDPEGYSLWFCNYKYNDENTVSFVTLNKVSGFLQRMDLARKYAFGKMLVIGSEAPYKVKGLWLFRGTEIPQFVLDECYDMELYDWTKVDINDEAQKERVNQMIEDAEPFEGEALLDAKCFK